MKSGFFAVLLSFFELPPRVLFPEEFPCICPPLTESLSHTDTNSLTRSPTHVDECARACKHTQTYTHVQRQVNTISPSLALSSLSLCQKKRVCICVSSIDRSVYVCACVCVRVCACLRVCGCVYVQIERTFVFWGGRTSSLREMCHRWLSVSRCPPPPPSLQDSRTRRQSCETWKHFVE